jgi:dTDP-4-amino-4,6-dideoxygalactose transaminase
MTTAPVAKARTPVPLLDLKRQHQPLRDELIAAFTRVLDSGHYILGPECTALEKECAAYVGAKHALGVSSGTDALLLALMALDIGPGDEVICPTYTFFATAGTVWRTGAKPVFVDSRPCCMNADPEQILAKITKKTKAIIPVHLFGQCADMAPVLAEAQKRNIAVIEDAAQAIGSEYEGRRAGTLGTFGCFSFFPSKNLGALGDAGLVTTNDDALAERARIMRTHGGKPKYYHGVVGGNFRIDELQAALIRVKLKHLEAYTERRQVNAELYDELFGKSGIAARAPSRCTRETSGRKAQLTLPARCQGRHIFNQYTLLFADQAKRDAVKKSLADAGVGTEIYYPVPMHLQQCFASLGHKAGDFPVAEMAANTSLALPIFPELTKDEVRAVVGAVTEAMR